MINKRILRLLALLFAFSLVAAACGGGNDNGDSGDSNDSGTQAAESEAEEEQEDEGGGLSQDAIEKAVSGEDAEEEQEDYDAPTFDRSTLDGIWEEADYNRQVMINEITEKMNAGEWGVGGDNILRGPAGYEADLNDCPADWSNTTGLLDDELRVGQNDRAVRKSCCLRQHFSGLGELLELDQQ